MSNVSVASGCTRQCMRMVCTPEMCVGAVYATELVVTGKCTVGYPNVSHVKMYFCSSLTRGPSPFCLAKCLGNITGCFLHQSLIHCRPYLSQFCDGHQITLLFRLASKWCLWRVKHVLRLSMAFYTPLLWHIWVNFNAHEVSTNNPTVCHHLNQSFHCQLFV